MDLTNASAIVTGAAGGFGSATVRRLAQKGAKVVIADVSNERGEALAREVAGSLYLDGPRRHGDAVVPVVEAIHELLVVRERCRLRRLRVS
jgi:NAD(P)-dependent dehydrogenase (short-subunit alcohol dehydrogenase family)